MKIILFLFCILFLNSCSVHPLSNIHSKENLLIELKESGEATRGSSLTFAIEELFLGLNYIVSKATKPLSNSYSKSISITNYYDNSSGIPQKTYSQFLIKKYSQPSNSSQLDRIRNVELISDKLSKEVEHSVTHSHVPDEFLSFMANVEIQSNPTDITLSRLCLKDLKILFSKTKVFSDENLNAVITVSIEGQWRDSSGFPHKEVLIEQKFNLLHLKYGNENQIKKPLYSPWYYDIPIFAEDQNKTSFGVINLNVQLLEYEGKKAKSIAKLMDAVNINKNLIIKYIIPTTTNKKK